MDKSVKVRVKIEHQLFRADGFGPGPIAEKGEILTVVGIKPETILGKEYKYFLVEIDGERYTSWPAHCEAIKK